MLTLSHMTLKYPFHCFEAQLVSYYLALYIYIYICKYFTWFYRAYKKNIDPFGILIFFFLGKFCYLILCTHLTWQGSNCMGPDLIKIFMVQVSLSCSLHKTDDQLVIMTCITRCDFSKVDLSLCIHIHILIWYTYEQIYTKY